MDKVISLLAEKNQFLEKFHELNELEILNFSEGSFENIEVFYQAREKILDLIRCIDKMIAESPATESQTDPLDEESRSEVDRIFKRRDEIVAEIVAQDLRILSYIETEKSNIIRELRQTQVGRKAVTAYASVERLNGLETE